MLQLIAHRGASKYAPENTMSAFMLAHQMGAHHIECDVILCADKVPIVIHDDDLGRTTNGRGKVGSASFSYIQSLDAGSWFGDEFAGTKVLSLRELLIWQRKAGVYLHLEIKPLPLQSLTADVNVILEEVYQFGLPEQTKILTFQYEILEYLNILNNQLPRVLGVESCRRDQIGKALDVGCMQINMSHEYLFDERIREIQQVNLRVGVYTVNHADHLPHLQALGVDEVFTDDFSIIQK